MASSGKEPPVEKPIVPGTVTVDKPADPPPEPAAPPVASTWQQTARRLLPTPLLIWQVIAAGALTGGFVIARDKLPDSRAEQREVTDQTASQLSGAAAGDGAVADAQSRLAYAAIDAWLKQRNLASPSSVPREKLEDVLTPLVNSGLLPKTLPGKFVDRILEKDGWLESTAKYGSGLLADYLHYRWREPAKQEPSPPPATPTITVAPVITVTPGTSRSDYRASSTTNNTTARKAPVSRCPAVVPAAGGGCPVDGRSIR